MCQFTFEVEKNIFMCIFIPHVLCDISFLYFQSPIFDLGFTSTSSNYYLIIINNVILFNAQTKIQYDAFSLYFNTIGFK